MQLISDLHTEFWNDPVERTQRILSVTCEPNLDFLLVAGDIVVPGAQGRHVCAGVFRVISQFARHILYVTGNHEYYNGSKEWTENELKESVFDVFPNVHWLDNSEITLDNRHFVGGTMWYPVGDGLNQIYEKMLNDSRLIRGFNWPERENAIFTNFARTAIKPETVVITHHMPSRLLVPGEYKTSQTNRFFVSDMTELIMAKQPKLWVCGHTHSPRQNFIDKTEIICNPYGYPGENKGAYRRVVWDV